MKEEIIDGIRYRLDENNLTAEVIEKRKGIYNDYEGDIIIPDTVKFNETTYRVTSIGQKAFYCCKSLRSITIPASVTSIGEDAFYNCSSLTAIKVAEGNTVYDSRENCNALIHTATNTLIRGCQNTSIPNSITSIGKRAFNYCFSLKSITIPASVTSIGEGAFNCCFSLKYIALIDSVKTIGECAFYRCESLKCITIPDSVRVISWSAFYGCKSLRTITIPDSVKSIEDYAFEDCESLKHIFIPDSVVNIGSNVFNGCKLLYKIHYDGTVEQWRKITKHEDWRGWSLCDVYCYDGHVVI